MILVMVIVMSVVMVNAGEDDGGCDYDGYGDDDGYDNDSYDDDDDC